MTGKERWEPGWKVLSVRCDGTLLLSPYAPRPLQYAEGEITEPESGYGPLTVFKSRRSAAAFVRATCIDDPVIVPCAFVRVPIPKDNDTLYVYPCPLWTPEYPYYGDLVSGTRLAKAVMLLPQE